MTAESCLVGIGFVLGNAVVQMIGFGFVVAQVAALVRYLNGVPRLAVERWSVGALLIIAASLPILLLIIRRDVVPAWIVQFSGESHGLALPMVSQWHPAMARAGMAVGGAAFRGRPSHRPSSSGGLSLNPAWLVDASRPSGRICRVVSRLANEPSGRQ
jgi:hypothetical protein